jgi:hypothetical protein
MVWRKKKWVIIGTLVGVAVLAAGIIGGAVYAQSGSGSSDTSPGKSFAARVAAIQGIDQTKVENAFAQARRDMQDEALTNWLNSQVSEGRMTQQQADQYKQWWQSKPDAAEGFGPLGRGFGGFHHMPRLGGAKTSPIPSTTPKTS